LDDPSLPSSPPPPITTLRVSATTTGPDPDADGYLVWIDNGGRATALPSNGSVTFYGLDTGTHVVHVVNVAPNCAIDGGALVVTISSPGISVGSDLHITCTALGEVRVTVSTTGTDRDTNGYVIAVTGAVAYNLASLAIPATGQGTLRVAGGRRIATLHGVAANCDGADLVPREFDMPSGGSVALEFAIVCEPAARLAYSALLTPTNSEIYSVRSDGTGTIRLTDDPGGDTDPAWSPDGTRIAFTSDRGGVRAVYVMQEDGTNLTRLTPLTSNNTRPAWSPDGSRIALVSDRDANAEIYTMNADGSDARRLTSDGAADTDPVWSPDGARIAFSRGSDRNAEVHMMNADGSNVSRLTLNDTWDGQPAWSRDGTLAFVRTECDGYQVFPSCYQIVFVLGAVGPPYSVGIGEEPAWSPDGRRIATTGFTCVDDFYYGATCTVSGVGILVPYPNGMPGARDSWDPLLSGGPHRNPTWRP
jgi:dipeptidyl aminopeptidase/acylaminoacyl peptidase